MKQKFLAELLGTFGIVFAPVALSASGKLHGGDSSLAAAAWVSGLAVLAMITAFGHISAAHFNPAVTLGFAVSGKFPWKQVPGYVVAQVLGATLAAGLTALIFGAGAHGTHVPAVGASVLSCLVLEATLACLLMLLILAVATDPRASTPVAGVAIGLCVVFLVWIGGPLTGGSMNPARSLGPALVSGGAALTHGWIYLLGPCLGTTVAARLYAVFR
ncbi:MIP/aquaporin family protein [Armatimonas rosea]|uniref:MIP family channel proteins n=1 Tax=Armatimonas rosea TaxID=685828 RepID=A0A7W9SMF9_ARMRO|nr:aquaporin [Armatimonas rosea]MBB6049347.1 MIP family channel proteins [Armatimonas rosea]